MEGENGQREEGKAGKAWKRVGGNTIQHTGSKSIVASAAYSSIPGFVVGKAIEVGK